MQAGNFGQDGASLAAVRLNEEGTEARAALHGCSMAVHFIRDRELCKLEVGGPGSTAECCLHVSAVPNNL